MNRWSPMGKLGAMAGDTTTTVIDMTPGAVPGSMVNGPEDLIDWDAIDWRAGEKRGRRARPRSVKEGPGGGRGKGHTISKGHVGAAQNNRVRPRAVKAPAPRPPA